MFVSSVSTDSATVQDLSLAAAVNRKPRVQWAVWILCHVGCGSDGRKTEYRSENVNSSRQLDGECEGGTRGAEGVEWVSGFHLKKTRFCYGSSQQNQV
jgi:hypothetical protein